MRIKNLIVSIKMPKKYDMPIHIASLLHVVFGTLMIDVYKRQVWLIIQQEVSRISLYMK